MDTKDILQECLEQVDTGKTIEEVLARYPEQRDELAPLLALATSLQRAAPKLSESAKARVRYQVYGAARRGRAPRATPTWRVWLARVAITLVAVMLLGGGTLVAAAESAPGGPLFPARALINETRARVATEPRTALFLHLENAEARLEDVQILKQRNRLNEGAIFLMVGETENLMVALESTKPSDRAILDRVGRLVQSERALLRELVQTGPGERPRRNAETLLRLSDSWEPLLNRLLGK